MVKRRGDQHGRFCRYGAWYLSRIHREFCAEIEGVKEGRDTEAVHRMRVASRRLRAGLPLFSRCFSKKVYQKVSRGVSRITSDLGDARDLDVQIGYLEGLIESLRADNAPEVKGCVALLSRKREMRDALQPKVIADCVRLEEKGIPALLAEEIGAWNIPDGPPHRIPSRGFPMKRSESDTKEGREAALLRPGGPGSGCRRSAPCDADRRKEASIRDRSLCPPLPE